MPGADRNPYLTFAAAIAAGLDGIERKLEPPPMLTGNVYDAADQVELPGTLRDATKLFAESDFVRTALRGQVQQHYAHFFESEQAAYDVAVTDWERIRYFEQV